MKNFLFVLVTFALFETSISFAQQSVNWPEYFSTSRNSLPVWARTLRRTATVDNITSLLPNSNIILTMGDELCGALGSGRDQTRVDAHIASITADGGVMYRNCIKAEAVKGIQSQSNNHAVYWHIGNEINSKHFSETMGTTGKSSDVFMIPNFVEYFVAPTIQALDEAGTQVGFDAPAVLGSIVSGHNPDSRAWLDTLLNYTIQGTYAPALAGKRVYEVVDYVSFHYTIAASNWEESYNDISKWIGQGKIKGIIDTEELGAQSMDRGAAQFQALQGFARFMHWVNEHGYTPTQGRLNFWAQGNDTPDEAMTILHTFLGETSLNNMTLPTFLGQAGTPEAYSFETSQGSKRLLAVFTPQGANASWTSLQFPAEGWGGNVLGNMYVFQTTTNTNRYTVESVTAILSGGVYSILRSASLTSESVVIILLTETTVSSVLSGLQVKSEEYKLEQSYPNPFNPSTTIRFYLPQRQYVTLKVFDMLGREVSILVNGVMDTGEHAVMFSANNLPGGVYFYQMTTQSFSKVQKAVLLK